MNPDTSAVGVAHNQAIRRRDKLVSSAQAYAELMAASRTEWGGASIYQFDVPTNDRCW